MFILWKPIAHSRDYHIKKPLWENQLLVIPSKRQSKVQITQSLRDLIAKRRMATEASLDSSRDCE